MSITQVSVFVESKPGHLCRILDLFGKEGISIRGYSCSDTGDYGIARFIVNDPERACAVLADRGHAVTTTEVVGLELVDTPGELARVCDILAQAGINVIYSYSLISTYSVFKVEEIQRAEALLKDQGITLVTQSDLR